MGDGNLGDDSGSGVAFTRDPATGRPGVYGDYLPDARGEDVVSGVRNTMPLTDPDLTQTVWGLSRDDVEAAFFTQYLDQHIFESSPFETLDREGVGRLVRLAVTEGRAARPGLKTGVCGEHGGDPDSVHFFHAAGLDYVSCSPFRVPVARLEAGRAAVEQAERSPARS